MVLSERERIVESLGDAPHHLRFAADCLKQLPAALVRFARLRQEAFRFPLSAPLRDGLAMGCTAVPGTATATVALLRELDLNKALVRVPYRSGADCAYSDSEAGAQHALVEHLLAAGAEVVIAVPQDRDAIVRQAAWAEGVTAILDRYAGRCACFQIGQAINRKKWGVWTVEEYLRLLAPALQYRADHPAVRLVGPPVLDFEFHYHLAIFAALNRAQLALCPSFDQLGAQLYVDRQGAPEWRHWGTEMVDKCALLAAIGAGAGHEVGTAWITEVNWPLAGHGDFAPAAGAVEVDPETYADYLVRYHLLALGSGMVERVYWWQLVARGYGLVSEQDERGSVISPEHWHRRPAFAALRTLREALGGCTFSHRTDLGGALALHFRDPTGGPDRLVAWAGHRPRRDFRPALVCERAPLSVCDRQGSEAARPGMEIPLGPSPTYIVSAGGIHTLVAGSRRRPARRPQAPRPAAPVPASYRRIRDRSISGTFLVGPDESELRWLVDRLPALVENREASTTSGFPAQVLHDARNRLVRLALPASFGGWPDSAVVKRFRYDRSWDRLRTLWSHSKARRAFSVGCWLHARGEATPMPLGYCERRFLGMVIDAYYVSKDAGETPTARSVWLGERADLDPELTAVALAPELRRLHAAGFLHRDLSDGNVLVSVNEAKAVHFSFVDLNRARVRPPVGLLRGVADLVRLGIPRALQHRFIAAYAGARFRPFHYFAYRALKYRFTAALRLKRLWRRLGGR